jgi:ubiquinone/menaquinone biosynthesis C-methylase UbiE
MDSSARRHAMQQWNTVACGELDGDKNAVDYFLRVERDRYSQQYWQREFFEYESFAGQRVLEIGVGQGTDLMQFARAGASCIGVDITENHLQLTARNFALQGKHVDLYKADATKLPLSDGSIDCVYSFGVIHHIPEAHEVVSEIFRVLRPGGTAMVALYYRWSAFHLFTKLLCHGLRCGWLWSKGYAGLLATIEGGADGVTVKPFVKLYSKREVRRLFSHFDIEDLSIHQLTEGHYYPSALGRLLRPAIPKLEGIMGWYVVCIARKPLRSNERAQP